MDMQNQVRLRIEALETHVANLQDIVNANAIALTALIQICFDKENFSAKEYHDERLRQTAHADQTIAKMVDIARQKKRNERDGQSDGQSPLEI